MIKKINKIKNFGIFKDYKQDCQEFKTFNVFYGWNYSGKTTLSRVFRCLEKHTIYKNYIASEIELIDETGNIDKSNLMRAPAVRVFNEDFIAENFNWGRESEKDIEPFFVLGEENIELQNELEQKGVEKEKKIQVRNDKQKQIRDGENTLSNGYTNYAREVKQTLNIPDFNKNTFSPYVKDFEDTGKQAHVLSDNDFQKTLSDYTSTEKKDRIPQDFHITLSNVASLSDEIIKLSLETVVSERIKRLDDNIAVSNWIERGIELHQDKKICEFCGAYLPDQLLETYRKHFSDAYKKMLEKIDNYISRVSNAKVNISPWHPAIFYSEYSTEVDFCFKKLSAEILTYNDCLDKLIEQAKNKKKEPFDALTPCPVEFSTTTCNEILSRINELRLLHNQKVEKFELIKKDAKQKIIEHFVGRFITDLSPQKIVAANKVLSDDIDNLDDEIKNLSNRIDEINARISELAKGADAVNRYLKRYFEKQDIQIKGNDNGKFVLMRGDKKALDLSNGEKTSIAFSYFLAKLNDKNTDIKNTIVYIDDPISSLDSRHLFNTYSAIRDFFYNFIPSIPAVESSTGQKVPAKHECKCKQLFISTHNFDFFNLLKDWLEKTKKDQFAFFYINRKMNKSIDSSFIEDMPSALLVHNSEYSYLFGIMNKFLDNPTDDFELLYMLPNVLRRFMEAFFAFKYQGMSGIDEYINIFIPDNVKAERVRKFAHYYSHSLSTDRGLKFPDLSECSDAINLIFEALEEKDYEHFRSLKTRYQNEN